MRSCEFMKEMLQSKIIQPVERRLKYDSRGENLNLLTDGAIITA